MAVTAADVKKLREATGVGPAECKKVLDETDGDFDKAVKILKEKGLAAAANRAGRAANQGRVSVKVQGNAAVLVELATETDFVARNPEFIALGEAIAGKVLDEGCSETDGKLAEMVKELSTKIRENMNIKRIRVVKSAGHLASYVHGDGAIGVVVSVSADKPEVFDKEEARALVFNLAMHVAAFNPAAISADGVDASLLNEQEEIFTKQMEADEKLKDKPVNVLEGILKGKIKKYLADICFLDQRYIKNDKITVREALAEAGKQMGAVFKIDEYVSFRVGA